jgi:hypothetical protein
MAMASTPKIFATTVTTASGSLNPIYAKVREFRALGGQPIFGIDVGYIADYTPRARSPHSPPPASATTTPEAVWDVRRRLTTAPV